jgi:hypothetical protein
MLPALVAVFVLVSAPAVQAASPVYHYDYEVHTVVDCAYYGFGDSVILFDESVSVTYVPQPGLLSEHISGTLTNQATGNVVTTRYEFVDRAARNDTAFVDVGLFYQWRDGTDMYLSVGRFIRNYQTGEVTFEAGINTPPPGNLETMCSLV